MTYDIDVLYHLIKCIETIESLEKQLEELKSRPIVGDIDAVKRISVRLADAKEEYLRIRLDLAKALDGDKL